MKKRNIVLVLTLGFVMLGLFTSCMDLFKIDLEDPDFTEPGVTVPVAPAPPQPGTGTTITVPGTSLAKKIEWIKTNAQSGNTYLLDVTAEYEEFTSQTLSFSGKSNITIHLGTALKSTATKDCGCSDNGGSNITDNPRVIALLPLLSDYPLFTIGYGVTLNMEENLILMGGIRVIYGGSLIMHKGVKITRGKVSVEGGTFTMNDGEISGNTASYSSNYGGGVHVINGTFTMKGGKISDNTSAYYGGGVSVSPNGTFTMNGGVISGNTSHEYGGGVWNDGTFTMNGGKISDNKALFSTGGVYVSGGTFTLSNGEISGNSASFDSAGGVYVNSGIFTMKNGKISGNIALSGGGGVSVNGGTFAMNNGEISGNSTTHPFSSNGGGVWVNNGIFTMSGGEISGNSVIYSDFYNSNSSCGGVYVNGNFVHQFSKTGGTIYGYTEGNSKSNVVKDIDSNVLNDKSNAVYVNNAKSDYIKLRRTTTTTMSKDKLSYIGRLNPPVWSGAWDF